MSLEISTVLEHKENLNNAFFKKKTQVRAIESDLKMVNQTIKLLSEGGVNAVTLEAVGVNAGYSRGLVSRRYGSKDQLLVRVLNYLENWLNEKSKIATNNKYGLDAINSLILSISDDFYLNREKYRAYFWLRFYGLESNKALNEYLVNSQSVRESDNIKWLKEALVLEQLSRNVDIEMVADFIMTSLMGLVHKWMVDQNFNIKLRLRQLVHVHLKNMFNHSHLYHAVNYWGNEVMQFTSLKWMCVVLTSSLVGCSQITPLPEHQVALSQTYPLQTQGNYQVLSWDNYVNDQQLINLVDLALVSNQDLKIASLRIHEAQAAYGIQRAELFPNIGGNAGMERNHVPADLSYVGREMTTSQYSVGLGMNQWELDLWGRIRSLNEAALQQFFAVESNVQAVRNSLIQQTVLSYLTLSELDKRIYFAQRSVQNYEKSVRLFKRRYEVGASSKVEYMQAKTMLSNGQALVTQLEKSRALTANYLVQLVGQPTSLHQTDLDQVTFKTGVLHTGLPSDLLLNRADIRASEAMLKSKHANINAARAAFFPRITLTGSLGTASADLDGLFKSGSSVWSFAPSISVPIFTAGRLKNNLILAEVRKDIGVAEYEKTVQNAFREVSDALAQQKYLDQQLQIQQQGLNAFKETERLAQLRYDNGAVGYLEVLDAQRNLLGAEQQWIETQSNLMQSYVNLYFALGGDTTLANKI